MGFEDIVGRLKPYEEHVGEKPRKKTKGSLCFQITTMEEDEMEEATIEVG